ncbi:MAG: argininosuccinate lyase [Flavobacteriaceae bacterium]|nr:argininosuccinate lyase [Flavobacteriaceae bacterium]MCI5088104.1 argininosuccinate lyase [Flavobacteriaceae bacterium]
MKLWDKGGSTHEKIDQFTVGNDRALDLFLAPYDVRASMAHAQMLAKVGLLSQEEALRLVGGLEQIGKEIAKGDFQIENEFEDVHSKIEFLLTQRLGAVGKKIHSARSRNDQVLVAMQLFLKDVILDLKTGTQNLFELLLDLAETHKSKILPGYTHLQLAMPSSFGLWFSSYAESLIDDVYFLKAAYKVCDQNPLGSAAGYGSSFPIDRKMTTQALEFSTLKYNVVAAQMGRGKTEKAMAFGMSGLAATLGKMAMDICLYMSQDMNFIHFPDTLTTGSSIMPHKKNPDVFELIRAKCNKIQSLPGQLSLLTTNLPSGYHRDLQLLKEILLPSITELQSCLDLMHFTLKDVIPNPNLGEDPKYDAMYSVETLNQMVLDGIPFREAYQKMATHIANGSYVPMKELSHSHEGSMGNLCLKEIKFKMNRACEF